MSEILTELWSPGVAARQVQKAIDAGEFKQGGDRIERSGDVLTYWYYHAVSAVYNLKNKTIKLSAGKGSYSTERKKRLFARALADLGYDLKPEDDYTRRILKRIKQIPPERLIESSQQKPNYNAIDGAIEKATELSERAISLDTEEIVPSLLKIGSAGKGTPEYEKAVKDLIAKIGKELRDEDFRPEFEREL